MRLDIAAVDSLGRPYDIEIQREDKGAVAKRARYNSSLLDANITEPGESYENLPESFVIFIVERDVLKAGLPIYHIHRRIEETGEYFRDGSHIIYVNGENRDETPLGKLMHDFSCANPDDMSYSLLADRVRCFKKDKEEIQKMGRVMDEVRNEGIMKAKRENALRMIQDGILSYEKIAQYTELSMEEVKELAEQKSA